ncbi:RT0821/Lpp0805 family surface protein [Magnetospirillum sp. UT-4]|uniref:RT0821/Lpp0805 family surface protein n=1 Tax=Magnetospirillum sp. UT-4 TaxID=2681467 RepID=UPI001385721D|nr:RT0821/Lpp0805 family surface protein [Magnetospirillum sp. UT-4]CAA7614709.1 17 kDa surface antigen [Magnetospirillum sp. UT-4]
MNALKKLMVPVMMVAGLAACSNDTGPKQTGGAILGGIGGAVAGAQFGKGTGNLAMTALGTLLGAYAGSEVGKSLDKADRTYAGQAETRAHSAPVGQAITWNNPDSGHAGSYTPTRDGYDQAGNYCREYQSTVTIDGKTETAFGTACRQPDGSWKVVK